MSALHIECLPGGVCLVRGETYSLWRWKDWHGTEASNTVPLSAGWETASEALTDLPHCLASSTGADS